MFRQIVYLFTFAFISLNIFHYISADKHSNLNIASEPLTLSKNYSNIRDTLYTFEPHFIIVNLSTQTGYLYSRNEPVMKFGISSGNIKLDKAVETNEGLFVIQTMMKKWYSTQFDSTLLIDWMGFNYGIGFHALKGYGYYRYLGVKKSSHGCVRISRDNAAKIFGLVDIGTPVLVNNGESALTIAFADSNSNYKYYPNSDLKKELEKRFDLLYKGRYLLRSLPKIYISKSNVTHQGLPIGNADLIPENQIQINTGIDISTIANSDVLNSNDSNRLRNNKGLNYLVYN